MDNDKQNGLAPMLNPMRDTSENDDDFLTDVLEGLGQPGQKTLPCKYLYDRRGSMLFDRICQLDEYYPTRTELAILRDHSADMARFIGSNAQVVELGSGSSIKVRLLLDTLDHVASYVPVDISTDHLDKAASRIADDYPDLLVQPVSADYTKVHDIPRVGDPDRLVAFFPGSTIGNFSPDEALRFLIQVHEMVGVDGGLLIGVDLKKDKAILDAAYNDRLGATAAFNRNLLARINRELPAKVAEDDFEHHAYFNEEKSRVEMHLRSRHDQTVEIDGREISFAKGETIHTENSYKFSLDDFAALARRAGFAQDRTWSDEQELFSIHYLSSARMDAPRPSTA